MTHVFHPHTFSEIAEPICLWDCISLRVNHIHENIVNYLNFGY